MVYPNLLTQVFLEERPSKKCCHYCKNG